MAFSLLFAHAVGWLTKWTLGTFTSPLGVFALGALDSTVFFSLPFGIDAAVIILSARGTRLAWFVPLLAIAGGVAGAALTFWMGAKIGEKGLDRYVSAKRLDAIRDRVKTKGAVALAAVDLIPPPFPFTPVVLAAGALDVSPALFFATLVVTRLIRFGLEAILAVRFGRRILTWIESDLVQNVIGWIIVLAVILTIYGIIRLVRTTRTASHRAAA